jgi:antitoxin component of MazEF toxin-antitoxin module
VIPSANAEGGVVGGGGRKIGFDRRWDVKHGFTMIKTISKIGNSHGIIFDSTLLQLAHLQPGDEVNLEVHPGGTITITPMKGAEISAATAAEAAKRIIGKNHELFRRLS